MNYPDLPRFDIPESCRSSNRTMSLEQYHEWVMENVRRLKSLGLYRQYRDQSARKPVDARFKLLRESDETHNNKTKGRLQE